MSRPLHLSVTEEDAGSTPFEELVARHYTPTPPADVRDRIELPALSPERVHTAVDRAVRGFTRRPGRHNRYVPVPGERSLRTDDIVDFLFCYGHEYRLSIFRAADVRTGSLLDPAAVHSEAVRQGSASAWDWTGAGDWLSPDELPIDSAFVFWSTHTSLIDGVEIPAGHWTPAEGLMPTHLRRSPFSSDDITRMRARSADFVAALGTPEYVNHPAGLAAGLPIVVIAGGPRSEAAIAVLADSTAILAVMRNSDDVVIVPRPDAHPDTVIAAAKAVSLTLKEGS